nr:hypothetical protein [Candidatus Sigynarchaeota archaeon]
MLKSFYIFNKNGALLFNHEIAANPSDPKLVGAFLSAISSWAEMYSQSGVALFMTGSMKFLFDQSYYASDLIFCIASSKEHPDKDLHERMSLILENFLHFFWEDRASLEQGIISKEKIEQFRALVQEFLNKE